MGRGSKFKDGIRLAAGAYLIYLAVLIIRDGIIGGGMKGWELAVGVIASIGFIVFGAVIVFYSWRSMMRTRKREKEEAEEEARKEKEAKALAGGKIEAIEETKDREETEKEERKREGEEEAADDNAGPDEDEKAAAEEGRLPENKDGTGRDREQGQPEKKTGSASIFDKAYGSIRGRADDPEKNEADE